MADTTPELIRDISVKTVEDFLNNKVPLSMGLAKQAAAHELNAEQVKRAVESTNNIAYLKVLQLSEDRTVEFPLAKYAEVMAEITVPKNLQEKIANAIGVEPQTESIEKVASAYEATGLVQAEKLTYFIKTAAANKAALEKVNLESMNVAQKLVKVAKELSKDKAWLDKLACVADSEDFAQLSILVSGEAQKQRDIKDLGLFKEAQLKQTRDFSDLYKQAKALVREQRERTELQKRADDASASIRKGFMNGAANAAKRTAGNIAGAPGYVIGRAAGSIASKPFEAASGAASAIKGSFKKNLNTAVSGGSGKVTGATKAVGMTAGGVAKGILNAAGPVADAAFYDPGVDESTGRSNDAWTALQRD